MAAAVAAFVITLAVLLHSTATRARQSAATAREEALRAQRKPLLTAEDLALGAEDFMLPPPPPMESEPRYVPFRPRLARWSAEIAGRYWVPPRDIATEIVEAMNDRYMERLFQDVK